MRKIIILCILVLFPFVVPSQQKRLDSLNVLLQRHTAKDTARLNLLTEIAYEYQFEDPNKGLQIADTAIALAKLLGHDRKMASAFSRKANNYNALGKDTLALQMYKKAIGIHRTMGNLDDEARTIFNMGLVYFGWANYSKSIDNYKKAYSIFEKEKDSFLMAYMLNSIGVNQMYLSNYPAALRSYLTAARMYESMGSENTRIYADIQSNIGILYKDMGKWDESLSYYDKALEHYKKNGNSTSVAATLSNMGIVYDDTDQHKKALDLYNEAYKINSSVGYKRGMASDLSNIGVAYTSLLQYKEALEYLDRSKMMYEELGDLNALGVVHHYLGVSYLNLVDDRTPVSNRFKSAEEHFKKSLEYSQQVNSLEHQAETWENVAKMYLKAGNYKKAFEAKNQYLVLKDSIGSQSKREEITRLELQYQFDKREAGLVAQHEKEQAVAQAEIDQQKLIRNISIYGGGGLLMIILGGLMLYKRKRDAVSRQLEAEFKATVADNELKALRAQLNPHFIYNSLNSIGDYFSRNDTESGNGYLAKFAKLMRLTLEYSEKKEVTLAEDVNLMELYLQIEALRLDYKFTFKIKIDPNLDSENTLVPPMILQPFIENSIWHGISPKKGKGHIDIDIKKDGDMIHYIVEDDGVGRQFEKQSMTKGKTSLGIKITENRIEIINKVKQTTGTVSVLDRPYGNGVKVEVTLPLELAF
ncbi:tetratricopeptide repeat protein [Flavobacteriaceae bacterium F89]|uniref:Tetratricopeptide repeat protein n=1 Tax=Cerina litoralis TaxID=2874477 RepID=A0AAE3ESF7_9FLAO|nr:tetratricopeptide repeat protein [Cerina litoralis]MCG2459603.1 tetratricopeptide repeat protein [Cerina litoralis]